MKRWAMIFGAAAASVWVFGSGFSQEEMVAVDTSAFTKPQRPASLFKHDEHNEKAGVEECAECHHVYEKGKKVADESSEGQPCAECHAAAAEGRKPSLTQAFHANCKGCHLQRRAGPVMCGQCHVWRPPAAKSAGT